MKILKITACFRCNKNGCVKAYVWSKSGQYVPAACQAVLVPVVTRKYLPLVFFSHKRLGTQSYRDIYLVILLMEHYTVL